MTRPAPPTPVPQGYQWVAVPDVRGRWMVIDDTWPRARRCRAGAAPGQKACGAAAVVVVNRPTWRGADRWWAYCPEHMWGRWIEDGKVWTWMLRPL